MFRPNYRAIFGLIFEQVECTVYANWKYYQFYTLPIQRSAWRWPHSWAETCSCN